MSAPEQPQADHDLRWRMRRIAVCVLLVSLCFLQAPGRVVPDTKLDLTVDPLAFLGRATELWDPVGFAGQMQNQAYGYLFPIGPFFALGDVAGLPSWAVQRLWWGLLLCLAFLGVRRLASELGLGSEGTQMLAGLAYVLSPRIMSMLGPVSAEAWPMALAPWVVIPLVRALRGGPIARPALRSAVVVGCMGGVNAALVLAAATPAALYLLTRRPGARWFRVTAWWSVGMAAACLWWVVPLLVLGRYSPRFLDFIEGASTTTSSTSLVQVLRGTSHWLSFLGPGFGSPWQIGSDLVLEPVLVLNTVIVAAVGLAGLCLIRSAERGWLLSMLLVGAVALTFGHAGPATSWVTGAERDLLDGLLAPLRNVHKFDPLVRLPLVLGLAHGLAEVRARLAERPRSRPAVLAVTGLVVVAVLGSAGTAVIGRIPPTGSFAGVPGYWEEAADWLEAEGDGRALLVPGSRFGEYYWGSPNDEPLQALTDAPWEVRNAVPLTPAGHIRMLDAVERRLAAGQGSPGLAAYLARNGVAHLLVRNDLDFVGAGTTRTSLVHQALLATPGLRKVREFGPDISPPSLGDILVDSNLQPEYASVEIWSVDPEGSDAVGPVALHPLDDAVEVSGDAGTLLEAADAGVLPSGPTVLSGHARDWSADLPLLVSDTFRRREVNFGASLDNTSHTLTQTDPLRQERPLSDYVDDEEQLEPARLALAEWEGVADVRVSSSASDATAFGGTRQDQRPAAAFDHDPSTAWRADIGLYREPTWMEVELEDTGPVRSVTVTLPEDATTATESLLVSTDGQSPVDVPLDGRPVIEVGLEPATDVSTVRVELVREPGTPTAMGIAELALDGVPVGQAVVLPAVSAGREVDSVLLTATTGHRDGCLELEDTLCSPVLLRAGEEDSGLLREWSMGTAQALTVRAQVRPVGGSELDRFLDQVIVSRLRAGVSSSAVPDPRAGAWAAVDGDRGTGWVAGADEPTPELTLTWRSPRVITAVRLHQDDSLAASVPTVVTLEADDGAHRYEVPPRGRVALDEPLRTDSLTIGFDQVRRVYTYAAATGATEELPVGVSEVWLAGGPGARVDLKSAEPVQVPCGGGPRLVVDGTELETAMSTSVRGLAGLEPTAVSVCADRSQQFAAGQHRLELDSGPLWRAEWALLSSEPQAVDASNRIDVNVDEWGDAERSVDVPYRDEPTLLSVTENANPGWRASLGGELLEPVTIDGWKQGYLVPAGDAGTVQLTFAPAGTYRLALIGGLALFLLLGLLTLAMTRRPARHGPAVPLRLPWPVATALVLSGLALLGGAWGLLAGIAVCAVGFMLRRVRRQTLRTWCSALAGTCYAVAGGLTLLSDGQGAMLSAVLALSALAVVLLSPRADPAASG